MYQQFRGSARTGVLQLRSGGRHFVAYAAEDEFFSPEDAERKERWLVSDLTMKPKGRETVVLMHPPPTVELLDLLSDYDVSLVLHGHTHISNVFTYRGIVVASVTPTSFGGIDTNPRGYRMVRFTETGFGMELKALGRGESSRRTVDVGFKDRLLRVPSWSGSWNCPDICTAPSRLPEEQTCCLPFRTSTGAATPECTAYRRTPASDVGTPGPMRQ